MGLRAKFNLVMISVFLAGLAVTGMASWRLLNNSARDEVIQNAGIMMGAAHAIRGYTVEQITPLIDLDSEREFVPQTVPAYAATEAFKTLQEEYPEYSYKEATINPTNPRDRATDWEADVIAEFQNDLLLPELVGERQTTQGKALWLARPIQIKNPDCLRCHSTVEDAPNSLVVSYGDANGFGWNIGDVVGSQIVTVPMALTTQKAERAFAVLMGSLTLVFIALFAVLNISLGRMVIGPITKISHAADQISLGNSEIGEFEESGSDEIATLKASFNRMRRSLDRAMAMISEG